MSWRFDPFILNALEGLSVSMMTSGLFIIDATTEAFVQVPWASVVAIVAPIVAGGVWVIKRTIERGEKDRELLSAQIEKEHTALTNLLKTLQTYVENATAHKEKVALELATVISKQDDHVRRLDAHVASLTTRQSEVMVRLTSIDDSLKKFDTVLLSKDSRTPRSRKKSARRA